MTTAPVCPISRSQPLPVQMGLLLPVPASVTDLPSAIKAINQLAQIAANLTAMAPVSNTLSLGLRGPSAGGTNADSGQRPPKITWVEQSRATERVRIHNPDDKTQYVDIYRITEVVFYSPRQSVSLVWDLTQ